MRVSAADSLPNTFGDAARGYISERQCNLKDHFLSALLWPPSTDLTTSTSHKNYAKFFTVIYLLSNKFVDIHTVIFPTRRKAEEDLFRQLDLILGAVPVDYLDNLIHSRLASTRAAYETLLLLVGYFNQPRAFQIMIKIGLRYHWIAIPVQNHQLLYYAVSMNLDNVVRLLLDNGCRPDLGKVNRSTSDCHQRSPTAICEALRRRDLECLHLLLDCCDVNTTVYGSSPRERLSNFDCFLVNFHNDEEYLEQGLIAVIRAGANVNKSVSPPRYCNPLPLGIWQNKPISVLDYLFYFHRRVFRAISSNSRQTEPGFLSRACILLSLEGGTQKLQKYLDSLAQHIEEQRLSEFLRILIAEQFLGCDLTGRKMATDLETVCALASYSVGIAEVLDCFPNIVESFVELIGKHPNECDMHALQFLLENGAQVGCSALSLLARLHERRVLLIAFDQVRSLDLHVAIAKLAASKDFEAVEILLHARVDLNVDTIDRPEVEPISLIARCIQASSFTSVEPSVMLDGLIRRGAVLRLSKGKPQLHHLLRFVLRDCHGTTTARATVQYLTRAYCKEAAYLPSSLLEDTHDCATFEYLFRCGVPLRPGSPLAHWIEMDGGIELAREMLAAGANPNAYSRRS